MILVFLGVLIIGIQNSYILQIRYEPHRLVFIKRSVFQTQKYGMPKHIPTAMHF